MLDFIMLIDIFEIFQDYGVFFTIFIIAILISYLMIKNSQSRIKEQENKIDSLYERIDKLMTKFTPGPEEKRELTGKFINYAENANKIQIQIYHSLQNFGAERVSIYEYHNGGKNLAGVEFKKCSNTYEAVSLETKPNIKEMQNLPISINPLWSKILATRSDINVPCVSEIQDSFLKSYLESQNIKTYHAVILEDYDNTPIGFITLEYYKHSMKLTQEQFESFNEIAIKVSILINLK
jgi:hypothetical protein